MKIIDLKEMTQIDGDKRIKKIHTYLSKLIIDLKARELPNDVLESINTEIAKVNALHESKNDWGKQLKKCKTNILKLIERKLQLVPKHHFQNLWMVYGMMAGIIFSTILSTMEYSSTWSSLGMGISIGMLFGLVAGKNRDEKAKAMGHQLNL